MRNWALYDPHAEDGTLTLEQLSAVVKTKYWESRAEPDFLLHAAELRQGLVETLQRVAPKGAFWSAGEEV